ncbi:MAG: MaoC/PaaZ C-terminal domain-containing protein, partial [Actinobacteria bacterium]|nr:MaoC/PaaZ C-terminal domain-containing protein [Actinomycetota bacterium]
MTEATDRACILFEEAIGTPEGHGDWYTMTQETINGFADLTQDHQFIHIDPEACKTLSPWGVPIAHGFLTLSMLTQLCGSIPQDSDRIQGAVIGVN